MTAANDDIDWLALHSPLIETDGQVLLGMHATLKYPFTSSPFASLLHRVALALTLAPLTTQDFMFLLSLA